MPKKSCINSFYDTQEIMKISITVLPFFFLHCNYFVFVVPFFTLFPGKDSKMYEKEMEHGVT